METIHSVSENFNAQYFIHCSKEDESTFPSNFDDDIIKKATIVFDWNNKKIVKDDKMKAKRAKKCITNMRRLLDNDNRRLVKLFKKYLFVFPSSWYFYLVYSVPESTLQITIFNLDDVDTTNEIDQAILYALLKGKLLRC